MVEERGSSRGSREGSWGSSDDRGSSHGGKSSGGSTPKPRLSRTTAKKDREYQAADHLEYDDEGSAHSMQSPGRSPISRENHHRNIIRQQSFRVGGNEGDLQALYEFLGVGSPAGLGIEASDWEARKSIVASRPPSPPSMPQEPGPSSYTEEFQGFQPNLSFDSSAGSPPFSPVAISPARPIEQEWKHHRENVVNLLPVSRGFRDINTTKRSPPAPTVFPLTPATLSVADTFPAMDRAGLTMESSNLRPLSAIGRESFGLNRRHSEPSITLGTISPPARVHRVSMEAPSAGRSSEMESINQREDSSNTIPLWSDTSSLPSAAVVGSRAPQRSSLKTNSHRSNSITSLRWNSVHANPDVESTASPASQETSVEVRIEAPEKLRSREKPSALIIEKVEESLTEVSGNSSTEISPGVAPKKPAWGDWAKGEFLGSGTFGTVYEGIGSNGMFFAVKEVSLSDQGRAGQQAIRQLEQEIVLLSEIQHPNIVQYLGTERDDEKLYIFLELVSKGSLAHVYKKYEFFYDQVRAYTKQILSGLKYLHDREIIHRDIKCANILVDTSGVVKLADFGMAKQVDKLGVLKSFLGSAHWMAPEVVNPKRSYNFLADIWSLGCTVLEMATGRPPFGDMECHGVLWKVGHGEGPSIPDDLDDDLRDFISNCLEVDVRYRPTCDMLLTHPFITGAPMTGPVKLVPMPELSTIAEERSIDMTSNSSTATSGADSVGSPSPSMITNMVSHTSLGGRPKSMRTRRSGFSMSSSESGHGEGPPIAL